MCPKLIHGVHSPAECDGVGCSHRKPQSKILKLELGSFSQEILRLL